MLNNLSIDELQELIISLQNKLKIVKLNNLKREIIIENLKTLK